MVTRIEEEMMDSIYGIVPPVVTPFREDDALDEGAFRAEIQYMVETAEGAWGGGDGEYGRGAYAQR